MHRLPVVITLFLFSCCYVLAQVSTGAWRDHLSYRVATHVAVSEETVYCAAGAGLIVYRKKDNSIEKLSKVNGLSDVNISCIKWSEQNKLLIAGYSNGNIDIISNNKIINLSDILRSPLPGSKSINSILFVGHRAYLSCNFGIVVVNLERNEISETYYLGEGGGELVVNDMAFDGTFLYAATSGGLYRGNINAPNLMDFSYWTLLGFLPEPGALFSSVGWFDGVLYTVQMTGFGSYVTLKVGEDQWSYFSQPSGTPIRLEVYGNYLALVRESETEIYSSGNRLLEKITDYGLWGLAMRGLQVDNNGNIWIADRIHGLVTRSGGTYRVVTPSGPYSNSVFSISAYSRRTYFAAGGYTSAHNNLWKNGEYNIIKEGSWTSRLNYDVRDVLYMAEHPDDPETHLLATWGYGLVEYRNGEFHKVHNEENSSLRSIIPGSHLVRIGGMAYDDKKNLWITNPGVPDPVSVRMANGEWRSFPFGGLINHPHLGKIIINNLGHKWVLLPRGGGLFVFDNIQGLEGNQGGLQRKFSITNENNSVISNEVYSIAEDLNGFIWVGINNGVVVYYDPSKVFSDENFYAHRVVVSGMRENEAGYLLNNETVTAIAIDGANRKWFGTEKSGVFLVSADGRQQIHHFTLQNSPLISNTITDIAIDPVTGEVFFGTTAGLVSFRGDATSPQSGFRNVYIFPNPVRENYDGPVTISGLMKDSTVKITDISGNLVFETVSLGGLAIWDGRNYRGHRVHTGIYLVFISNQDGSQTHVSKLMFIH
jgi:hypothetical protein